MPVNEDIPQLLDEVQTCANDVPTSAVGSKLTIENVSRSGAIQDSDYTRISIELHIYGTYDQLIEFCWSLARMNRIVHVVDVQMSPRHGVSQSGEAPLLDISLYIEAFYRPQG